jgi:uncharacterized lipoprotein YddW (UPF0748 family)
MRILKLIFILIFVNLTLSQPKREFRGIWVASSRLDFPKSSRASKQKDELDQIVNLAKYGNFNAIIFQVIARGQAYYESKYVPWASFLTSPKLTDSDGRLYPNIGVPPGTDPSHNPPEYYDPLKYLIQKAHSEGIEVHAWMNVYNILTLPDTTYQMPSTEPRHIAIDSKGDWNTSVFAKNSRGEWLIPAGSSTYLIWLDPANPSVRNYLINVAVEIVKKYDIDGIHFDYIRFPGGYTYGDSFNYYFYNRTDTLNGNPGNLSRDEFARLSIERFVRAVYDSIRRIKPWVKVGTTTPGIYQGWRLPIKQAYFDIYRDGRADPRRWAKLGIIDYHAPQIYWSIGSDYDFRTIAQDWNANMYDRHSYMGLAGYRVGDDKFAPYFSEIQRQIDFTRSILGNGTIIFRLMNGLLGNLNYVDTLRDNQYRTIAIVPEMPWKDDTPPNPPKNVRARKFAPDIWQIVWETPDIAYDGERAFQYVIYREEGIKSKVDLTDPSNIVDIVPSSGSINFYRDRVPDTSKVYTYVVTSLDRLKNESIPSAPVITGIFIKPELPKNFSLGQNYPNPFNISTGIRYTVPVKSLVEIKIYDVLGREVKKLAGGIHEPGVFHTYWDGRDKYGREIAGGLYIYRMVAIKNGKIIFLDSKKMLYLK